MKIPLAKPVFNEEMKEAAVNALENEWYILGESVFKFEKEFAEYCNVKRAVAVSSGTNALQIALLTSGVKQNQEVMTSSASFIASANAVIHAYSKPTFADIDLNTYTLDPKSIEKNMTKKTSAILPVYLYGRPADIDGIKEAVDGKNISIIADAAQAHGAKYKGKVIGGLVDMVCFSFYTSKCMTVCGDGGMITTNDEEKADLAEKIRNCGRVSKYEHDVIGYTSRLNTVNAAIGRIQLKYLDKWNNQRRTHINMYNIYLNGVGDIILPPKDDDTYLSAYYLYVIRTNKRDQLMDYLSKVGIQTGIHYPIPIHLQPIYKELYGYKTGDYPHSEVLSNMALSLPLYPEMTEEEVQLICTKVSEFYNK